MALAGHRSQSRTRQLTIRLDPRIYVLAGVLCRLQWVGNQEMRRVTEGCLQDGGHLHLGGAEP